MTKIDLTPIEQAQETARRLAHERIERLECQRDFFAVGFVTYLLLDFLGPLFK